MKTSLAASLFTALLVAACSATPDPSPGEGSPGSQSQAICGNGVRPGCGDCRPDASSPKGGYRTCWTCDGDSYQQACIAYPTITATWSGHVWVWTTRGPSNGDFSIPVKFMKLGSTWHMYIESLSIPLGVTVNLQPNSEGTGLVSGDSATLQLPIEASGIDTTLNLTTDSTIYPIDGSAPVTIGHHSPSLFQMVGQDSGNQFQAFLSGSISAWP